MRSMFAVMAGALAIVAMSVSAVSFLPFGHQLKYTSARCSDTHKLVRQRGISSWSCEHYRCHCPRLCRQTIEYHPLILVTFEVV